MAAKRPVRRTHQFDGIAPLESIGKFRACTPESSDACFGNIGLRRSTVSRLVAIRKTRWVFTVPDGEAVGKQRTECARICARKQLVLSGVALGLSLIWTSRHDNIIGPGLAV